MVINGYYNDGEVKMLYSIVVMVMKGERVLELGPVFLGVPVSALPKDRFVEREVALPYSFKLYGSGLA